ncbi:MAG: hypothetical protein JWO10_807, partial [Microbacteriaceae bacterium]|nr:hypothetical protein [Microbacteriaceae bacterium]
MTTTSSGTLDPVTTNAVPGRAAYWRLWRAVPLVLGFLLLQYPIALAGFIVGVTFVSAGAGTMVTFFLGAFILIA